MEAETLNDVVQDIENTGEDTNEYADELSGNIRFFLDTENLKNLIGINEKNKTLELLKEDKIEGEIEKDGGTIQGPFDIKGFVFDAVDKLEKILFVDNSNFKVDDVMLEETEMNIDDLKVENGVSEIPIIVNVSYTTSLGEDIIALPAILLLDIKL
jgi:hypothetical protein